MLFITSTLLVGGCVDPKQNIKPTKSKPTFHEKVGWKAGDFFEDADVIQLCQAIQANDLPAIERELASGVDVNTVGKGGMTPLLWAFVDNELQRFELLLERGADPNVKISTRLGVARAFEKEDSVTTLAARSFFVGPYEAVWKHGGDVAIEGRYKQPLLHIVVRAPISQEAKKRRIKLAISHGGDIQQKDSMGTIATTAVGYGQQWELALWLLDQGVDPNYYRPMESENLVGKIVAHENRLTNGTETAYWNLIKWLENDGHDIDAARKSRDALLKLRAPNARSRFIKNQIAAQVEAGLRPDPNLGEAESDAWYAEKREAKRSED